MLKRKHLLGLFSLLLVGMVGCSQQPAAPAPAPAQTETTSSAPAATPAATESKDPLAPLANTAKVMIAEDGGASGAGFYIADKKGYFKEYNIEVEFVTLHNSGDMLPTLASGEIDIAGGIASASFFNALSQGIDVKMITDKGHNIPGQSYFNLVIRKDLEGTIKDYKDLKGKKIGLITPNGVDQYILDAALKHGGLTPADVEKVVIADPGNILASLQSKELDAATQIEPLITQGVANNILVPLGDTTDFLPKGQTALVLASPDFTKDKEVSLRFIAAYLRGVRDYNDAFLKNKGKDEIISIMTEYTHMKDPAQWQNIRVTGLNANGELHVEDILLQYEYHRNNGGTVGEFDVNKNIDTSLVEEAVKLIGTYE